MDYRSYVTYLNTVEFNWLCPRCVADMMPFHDCSTLSSSSRCTSVSCSSLSTSCDSSFIYDLPVLSSPAGLRVAHLNCHNLLSIADEVSDLIVHNSIDVAICCY